jgi:hypothetical protein
MRARLAIIRNIPANLNSNQRKVVSSFMFNILCPAVGSKMEISVGNPTDSFFVAHLKLVVFCFLGL